MVHIRDPIKTKDIVKKKMFQIKKKIDMFLKINENLRKLI